MNKFVDEEIVLRFMMLADIRNGDQHPVEFFHENFKVDIVALPCGDNDITIQTKIIQGDEIVAIHDSEMKQLVVFQNKIKKPKEKKSKLVDWIIEFGHKLRP